MITRIKTFKIRDYNFHLMIHIDGCKGIEASELYSSMNSALLTFLDLTEHALLMRHPQDTLLMVTICDLAESLGTFYPNNMICIHRELLNNTHEFEKTFFHELVHFLFNGAFLRSNSFMPYLSEAVALFFENYYYPNFSSLSLELLYDRLTKDNYAAGYFMIERLFRYERSTLRLLLNKHITETDSIYRQEAILKELSLEECGFVNELIKKTVDILIIEPENNYLYGGYGLIYRRLQMDSPIITKIDAGEIINNILPGTPKKYEKVPACMKDTLVHDTICSINEDYYEEIALIYGRIMINNAELYNRVYNTFFLYQ